LFAAENTALTYVIADGVAEDKFAINSTTGLITTTTPLDRETRDSWIITGYYYSTNTATTTTTTTTKTTTTATAASMDRVQR